MQVSHRFVKLSEQDSGKQHVFTWRDDNGKFLCHAMYQSGADRLTLADGIQAPRGQVLRLLTKEVSPEHEEMLAPSKDAQSGALRIQIDGPGWQAEDYTNAVRALREDKALDTQQQCAALCQLASLYNLMATRYGQLFEIGLEAPTRKAVDDIVTDRRLHELSHWCSEQATAMLEGRKIAPTPLELSPVSPKPATPKLTFQHGIEPRNNQKIHTFAINDAGGKPLLTAEYQSGSLGESILIDYPLPGNKSIAVPYNLMNIDSKIAHMFAQQATELKNYDGIRDIAARYYDPVAASYQLQKLDYYRKMYNLTSEQQAATLVMLGSVTRLFATRYQREFESIYVKDAEGLKDYIKVQEITKVADDLLGAGTALLRDKKFAYPHLFIGHKYLETGNAVEELESGIKTLDLSVHPFLDSWLLVGDFRKNIGNPDAITHRYPRHIDHSVGHYEVREPRCRFA